jgi:hypothetical protein
VTDYSFASYASAVAAKAAQQRHTQSTTSFTIPSPPPNYSNPIDPNPSIFRPPTPSCNVQFLNAQQFVGDAMLTINYSPPASCPGPWSKVVLDWDTSVSGVQYDRTAEVWMNGAEIFRGTTSEPPGGPISYHVEKDLTEYTSSFKAPGTLNVELANYTDSNDNGIYVVNARLTFYQATSQYPAPSVPDAALAIGKTTGLPSFWLASPSDQASAAVTLPRNAERAYLEVYAMGQSNDEFWSFNAPPFREVTVSVDGTPAGAAWPFHYIFTGGLDPDGWIPITAIDAHDIQPELVDLTPFVGQLTDGNPHVISMQVVNDANYWMVDGDVLVYDDPGSARTTGALTNNTLSAAAVQSYTDPVAQPGTSAEATDTAFRTGEVSGYLNTSHGRVSTTVQYDNNFKSQAVSQVGEPLQQDSVISVTTTTSDNSGKTVKQVSEEYPLSIAWVPLTSVKISQGLTRKTSITQNGTETFYSELDRTLTLTDAGVLVGASAPQTDTVYRYQDWSGACYYRHLAALDERLTTDESGCNSLGTQSLHRASPHGNGTP